eukprot:scaffold21994_cov71-Phaeocystis_antarctica.AAC.2
MRRPSSGLMSSPSSSSSSSASSTRYRRSFTKHRAMGRFQSPVIERRCSPAREKTCRRSLSQSQRNSSSPTNTSPDACLSIDSPNRRGGRAQDHLLRIFVARDLGAVVSEAADLTVGVSHIKELLAYGDIAIDGRKLEAAEDGHVASKNAYRGARPYYQLVAARYQAKRSECTEHIEQQIPREVESHSCQAPPALARCLPAVRPPRAHRGHCTVRQLQRRQQVWHQVT